MKLPARIASAIHAEGDNYIVSFKAHHWRLLLGGLTFFVVVAFAFGIWGIAKEVELVQLRQQTQLQGEQLKLLEQKTKILEEKMKTLDSLDQELRQMVTGAEKGTAPQGGGSSLDVKKQSAAQTSTNSKQLLSRLYKLEKQSRTYLQSFYTLRSLLKDGSAEQIKDWQSTFALSSKSGDRTKPSIWPVKGAITSTFGTREDPVYGGAAYHEGLDIVNDYGTPIEVTADGLVTIAGEEAGYGYLVEVAHANGLVTRYGHNSTILVAPGQQVKQGDIISLMGSTGKSTGTHLHYEVRINGTAVDPLLFLPVQ